jgi:hypothetical protein
VRNHEVKTGRTDRVDDLVQCEKDGRLKRAADNDITDIVWHFVGNSRYNTMGPSREQLDCWPARASASPCRACVTES